MSDQKPDPFFDGLCKFEFADGRHCRMPAHPEHKGYCLSHAAARRRSFHREDDLIEELSSPTGDYFSQIDINHVLGRLFEALAANRVSPRRAATLAYIGQLLLRSQKGAHFEANNWNNELKTLEKICSLKYFYPLDAPAAPQSTPAPAAAPDPEFVFTLPPKSTRNPSPKKT